jgi:hypothetical protein
MNITGFQECNRVWQKQKLRPGDIVGGLTGKGGL